jgi:hypothetical protein
MPFSISSNPTVQELSDAVNYLLSNFGSNVSIDATTGIVAGPTGNIGYLYKYLYIKYAQSYDGSVGFSNSPVGATYYGSRNNNSSTESTNPTDYVWTAVTGGFGSTKSIWYATSGGRQISLIASATSPGLSFVVDSGAAIDLDVITGTNALMAALPAIYKWTTGSAPARPSTTSTYTWVLNSFSPPSGWSSSIPSDTTPGDTLWAIYIPLSVLANTVTSTLDWTNTGYPIVQVSQNGVSGASGFSGNSGLSGFSGLSGYSGYSGSGGNGLSALTAYKSQSQSTAAPSTPSNTSGATAPSGWSLTAPSVSVGSVLYYTFGQYNSSAGTINGVPAGQTQWGTPTAASIFQDIESDNWNGSTPPTYGSSGTYGTSGYYIQRSTGNVYFNNGVFRGNITGASGTFSGDITGATGTFAGSVTSTIYSNKVTLNETSTNWFSVYATGGSSIFSILGDGTNYVQAQLNGNNSTLGAFRVINTGGAAAVYGANTGTGYGVYGNTTAAGSYGVYGVNSAGGTAMYSGGLFGTSSNALVTNLYSQYTYYLKRQGSGSGDIYFYTGPATGGSVAAFSGTNKPGPTTGASNSWIEVYIGGTSYQIPVWAT